MADYGIDPSIVSYLQGVDPSTQQVGAEYAPIVNTMLPPMQPVPPPPTHLTPGVDPIVSTQPFAPGRQKPGVPPPPLMWGAPNARQLGVGETDAPAVEETHGLPAPVLAGIQSGFALPVEAQQPDLVPVHETAPDVVAGTVATPTDAQLRQSNAAYGRQQAFDASPEGVAQRSDAMSMGAIDKERQANADALAAEQGQNDANARVLQASAARKADQAKIDDAKAAEDQANAAKYTQQYAQQIKDAADYRVDTDRHVGIGGLIAIALSGIGDALDHRHGPNAALQIIENGIDKRVADQWQQKDALGKKADATKGVLDQYRRNADDDRQAQQFHRAAELDRAADDVRQVAAQYANPLLKARAETIAAGLNQKLAAITMGEAQRKAAALRAQQEERDRQAQIGIAAGHLGLASKGLDEQIREHDLERKDKLDQLNLEYAKLGQKDLADKAKTVAANGVFDPTSGNSVLDSQGQAKMDQADKYEAAARQSPPEDAVKYRQQAQQLRNDAEVNNAFTIDDKDARREIVKSVGAGQKMIDTIERIKQTLAQDPSSVDRSTWAALKTDFESTKADWIEAHRGKPSSREFDAIGAMFGDDPASLGARIAGRGKMIASLDNLKLTAIGDTTTDLRANGYKGQWRPRAVEAPAAAGLSGQTSQEAGDDAELGAVSKHLSFTTNDQRRQQAENAAPATATGLAPEDEQLVRQTMAGYGTASDQRASDIVNRLAAYASSPRPSISYGVIGLLREDPALYKQVLAKLPADKQKELTTFDRAQQDDQIRKLGIR